MAITKKASNLALWVILLLLIVGLAGFGIGSFGGSVRVAASVGETEITVEEYGRALQARLRQLGEAGGPTTFAEAEAQGLDRAVLQQLLARAALTEAARMAGLSVGDARVSERVLSFPGFQGADGGFDREAYDFVLRNNGLNAAEFEAGIRDELALEVFQAALAAGVVPQPAYAEAIYAHVGERRAITHARLGADMLQSPVPEPDPAAVEAYYDANPDRFRLPERKRITYAWLTPEMAARDITVSDEDLRAAYDARSALYSSPDRRMVERLAFPDEAAAAAAMAAIDAGESDFDALLDDRGLSPEDVDLGIVESAALGAAAEGVFALAEPGIAGPLPSPVGPALYRVNAVLPAQETPFADVADDLRRQIALERAQAVLEDEVEPLDDLLAGGATLEDLAEETAMELGEIAWSGMEDAGIAAFPHFRDAADAVEQDDFPEIRLLGDGSLFALRLDSTSPPEVPPLEEVRESALEGARADAVRAALADRAEAARAAIAGGAGFEEVGLAPEAVQGLSRQGVIAELPPGAIETVFVMETGDVRRIDGADAIHLVRLDSITPADREAPDAEAVTEFLNQQAAQTLAEDILTAVARDIEAREGITINQAALNAVHAQLQ